MVTPAEMSNLTKALNQLDRDIKKNTDAIRELFGIAKALNENIVQLGRLIKKVEEPHES